MSLPKRPFGRSLADFGPLNPAEEKLLAACASGIAADVNNERPKHRTVENLVRADLLRFLALGGDDEVPIHEHGVMLIGAWIDGDFDLESATVPKKLNCTECNFEGNIDVRRASFGSYLCFDGSAVRGIKGDGVRIDGDLWLERMNACEEVRLVSAQINGEVSCSGGVFENSDGPALSADGALIKASFFLDRGFRATGAVRLPGAQIGGELWCSGGALDGTGL